MKFKVCSKSWLESLVSNDIRLNVKQCLLKMTYTFLCNLACDIFKNV